MSNMAHGAELTSHDTPICPICLADKLLGFAHSGDPGTCSAVAANTGKCFDYFWTTDFVFSQAAVLLKCFYGPSSARTKNAVHSATVKTQARQRSLQFGNIVSAQVRGAQIEQSIPEVPRRLMKKRPCQFITFTSGFEPVGILKCD